ncbi:hypothetical protein BDZ88DRAFT_396405 [Geranomyces variabilis]|nr:hypothetical protein BDZ88DRAFT_396405 [Geranomyces variabilis]
MPCFDRQQEQCTWSIDIIVPSKLGDVLPSLYEPGVVYETDPDSGIQEGNRDMIVVCSGHLDEEFVHPTEATKKICRFSVAKPASACSILLAIGPFHALPVPGWMSKEQCLCAPFPHSSYKQVFLEDVYNPVSVGATIAIFSTDLLLNSTVVDQTYETTRLICRALVAQWFGLYVVPKTWADAWLMVGLTNYLVGLFMLRSFGKNEHKFRLQKDMQRVCDLDVNQPPIYPTLTDDTTPGDHPSMIDPLILQHFHPDDDWASVRSEFISLKAPIVLYMLDRRMGKGMLRKVVGKLLHAMGSGELPNGLSTHHFLRLARKITGKLELKVFADQWIYGSGCPRFNFKYNFNRKKMVVEFRFWQDNTNGWIVGSTPKFTGPFMIRIHEPGGTYDTEVHIEDAEKQYDIQYHTKYKRIRRKAIPTAKGKKGELENGAGEENVAPREDKANDAGDSKMEWNDEEPDRLDFEWIRLDPDSDWLCVTTFEQSDYMWAAQLRKDKNVDAQLEAIEGLHQLPSLGTCNVLFAFVTDKTAFYGLRMEAAYALAKCVSELGSESVEKYLLKPYRDKYCLSIDDGSASVYPKSHDFTELQEYYVKKAAVSAMSLVRLAEELAPVPCRRLLLDLLKYNDNTGNMFSDNYFVANLIAALGNAFLPAAGRAKKRAAPKPTGPLAAGDCLSEIHRYRVLDRLIPSYHNSVTIACLEVLLKYENFLRVRLVALDALFLLDGLSSQPVASFLLDLVADDPVPYVRYHVAKAMAEFVEVLAAESTSLIDRNEALSSSPDNLARLTAKWDAIRLRIAAREEVGQRVWDMMNSRSVLDHRVRFNLLRFCEYLYDAAAAPPPRLRIKVAPRRVVDDSASEDEGVAANALPKRILLIGSGASAKAASARARIEDRNKASVPRPSSLPPGELREPDLESNVYRQAKKLEQFLESAVMPEALANLKTSTDALVKAPPAESSAAPSPPLPQTPQLAPPLPAAVTPARTASGSTTAPVRSRSATPVPASSAVSKAAVSTAAGSGMSSSEVNRCRRVWKTLRISPYGHWFAAPVDPIALGIPTYLHVVKKPMDLQTIRTKLESGADYKTPKEFEADVRLMLSNSLKFNPPDTAVHRDTRAMLALFDKEWESAPRGSRESSPAATSPRPVPQQLPSPQPQALKRQEQASTPTPAKKQQRPRPVESTSAMTAAEVTRCDNALTAMEQASQYAAPFRLPVSKVLYPEYHRDIKKPMDLSTIRERLKNRNYNSPDQFEADVRLMFRNCYTFNRVGEPVYAQGKSLEAIFDARWSSRNESAPQPPSKLEASQVAASPTVEKKKLQPQPPIKVRAPGTPAAAGASSSKGKVASTPSRSASPAVPSFSPEEQKMCADVLKTLSAHPSAAPFLLPVDPVALNIPNYPLIVKRPMDISTIRKKLNAQTYPSADAMRDDFHLMLNNCFKFNQPGDWVSEQGRILETQFETQWEIFLAKSGAAAATARGNKPQILGIISKLQHFEQAGIFLQPVDPVMFPNYRVKIRKPMDLSTMERRARAGEYAALREFESDFRLMIANCFAYNPKTSFGHNCGLYTEKFFNREWKAIMDARDESKKRKKDKDGRTGEDTKRKRDISEAANPTPPARKKVKQEPAAGTASPAGPSPFKLKLTMKK